MKITRIDPYKRGSDTSDGDRGDAVMSVNLKGAYLCGKFAFEDMKKRRWGRMIHISSLWAYQPANERMLSYAAAKSATLSQTDMISCAVSAPLMNGKPLYP